MSLILSANAKRLGQRKGKNFKLAVKGMMLMYYNTSNGRPMNPIFSLQKRMVKTKAVANWPKPLLLTREEPI